MHGNCMQCNTYSSQTLDPFRFRWVKRPLQKGSALLDLRVVLGSDSGQNVSTSTKAVDFIGSTSMSYKSHINNVYIIL